MFDRLKLGDILFVRVDPRSNNGSDKAAGIVVRLLNVPDADEDDRVNVKVFLDGDNDLLLRDVPVFKKAPDEEAENFPEVYAVRP